MEIHIVLALLCVVFLCGIFLGHANGYRRGKRVGFKQGAREGSKIVLNSQYRRMNRSRIIDVNSLYPFQSFHDNENDSQ